MINVNIQSIPVKWVVVTVAALTAQGISIICLFVVFIPDHLKKGGAFNLYGGSCNKGGAQFRDATTTMKMQNFILSLHSFLI